MNRTGTAGLAPVLPRYAGRADQEWLLLPGWAQTGAHWVAAARWLSSMGVVLSCPNLGAIAAACSEPRGSLGRTLRIVDALVELAGGRTITAVVAHSAGTTLAALLAGRLRGLRATALVEPVAGHYGIGRTEGRPLDQTGRDLVGVESAGTTEVDRLRALYPMAATTTLNVIASAMVDGSGGSGPEEPARLPGPGEPERQEAAATALANLPVPVLLVRGEASTFLSVSDADAVLTTVPKAIGLSIISRAGHSPHVDRPRETAAALGALVGVERGAVR